MIVTATIDTLSAIVTALSVMFAVWHDSIVSAMRLSLPAKRANRRGYRTKLYHAAPYSFLTTTVANLTVFIYLDEAVSVLIRFNNNALTDNDRAFFLLIMVVLLMAAYAGYTFLVIVSKLILSYVTEDRLASL